MGQVLGDERFAEQVLYRGGQGGYHTYRIPGLVVTLTGRILALCEGRRYSAADAGSIDILLRSSDDNGVTWSDAKVVVDGGGATVGNPCPVVDRNTGRIWLFFNWNPAEDDEAKILAGEGQRGVLASYSDDDGRSWSSPMDLTSSLKRKDWTWYAIGPGHGIQLSSGRLLYSCNHAALSGDRGSGPYTSHIIYSDDGGASWHIGGSVGANTNECQVVELATGRLYLNMRSYHGENRRAIAHSDDGGLTWTEPQLDWALMEPVCHGSAARWTLEGVQDRNRLLFANAASIQREKMTVRLSYDEGETWPVAKLLYLGPAAYPELAVAPNMMALCLYERGVAGPYEEIVLARFSLDWLTDGQDTLG